jgi:hypothetical protein
VQEDDRVAGAFVDVVLAEVAAVEEVSGERPGPVEGLVCGDHVTKCDTSSRTP